MSSGVRVRTRFAPSPTGDLHLGGAWTALASWVLARSARGEVKLRFEDLDSARVLPHARARITDDLLWLGLDWDGEIVLQGARTAHYEDALGRLVADGLVYACDCSRTELTRLASAPHAGEESVYPGVCREGDPARAMKRPPALRVRVPDEVVSYLDGVVGRVTQNLGTEVGDFVLRRGDGVFAYQLAVVVDDVEMGSTDVVRGDDLVASTPRQIWLARALGLAPPRYHHVPMVLDSAGARLEKRRDLASVRMLRDAKVPAESIIGRLAHGLGLTATDAPVSAAELARACAGKPIEWRRTPWAVPESWQVAGSRS